MPSAIRYVMIGTGNLAHWPIQEMLIGKVTAFERLLTPEARRIIQEVRATNISGFECDFQEPLDRLMVLAHEIFHVLVALNHWVKDEFRQIIEKPEVRDVFNRAGQPLNLGHIEELFCDFGAAWFFGPAYAKAFIEEIAFRERERTETHPQRTVRLLTILSTRPKKKKYHAYFLTFSRYLRGQKGEIDLSREDMETIVEDFRLILLRLGLGRYAPSNNVDTIKNCIGNNVSFIYAEQNQDVRGLVNNLPDKANLSEREQSNYNDFLLESVRKNTMWHEFNIAKRKLQPRLPPHR